MTTPYNPAAVSDAVIAYGKPMTLQQGRALRDIPIAIAEGTPGAVKIAQRIVGAAGSTITFTGLGDYSGFIADFQYQAGIGGSPTADLTVSFSDDGTTFYGAHVISAVAAGGSGKIWVDFATGNYGKIGGLAHATGTISGASLSIVAVRFVATASGGGGNAAVSFMPNGGIL
jgi:hypothetical protein